MSCSMKLSTVGHCQFHFLDTTNLTDCNNTKSGGDRVLSLSMNKISHKSDKFELNAMPCSERRRAICRLKTPAIAAPSKPPQFPCLKKTNNTRRKRTSEKLSYENSK